MVSKNIMYFSYQEYFIHLANNMKKHQWEPVFWCTNFKIESKVKTLFPSIVCHDHYQMAKGIIPEEISKIIKRKNIENILNQLSSYEEVILKMISRNDSLSNSMTLDAKKEHYYLMVNYWLNIIEKLNPEYAIFEEEPHQASEYILYAILSVLKIKTIMFINTKFYKTLYPVMKFEDGSKIIKNKYKKIINNIDEEKILLSPSFEDYINKIKGSFLDAIEFHLYTQKNEMIDMMNKNRNTFTKLFLYFSFFYKKIFSNLFLKRFFYFFRLNEDKDRFESDQKQRFKKLNQSNLTYIEYLYYKTKTIIKKKFLKGYYDKNSTKDITTNIPYVYFCLQYQPEKTSLPQGNLFDDQLKILDLLSKTIPQNWEIYVREHPSQFISANARYGEKYRSVRFYQEIKKTPRTRIISLECDHFNLIDNAKASISITGTSGWESILRGVPSINFGYSWYRFCEGSFYVDNSKSLLEVINTISNGYSIDDRKVKAFVHTIQMNSYNTFLGNFLRNNESVSEQEIGKKHAEAIQSILTSEEYSDDISYK